MKCSQNNEDLKAVVKKAYELGTMQGENRLQITINKLKRNNNVVLRANQRLAAEVLRLDQLNPLKDAPSIIIPLKKAKAILTQLPRDHYLTTYLQSVIAEQMSLKS